jgi:cell division protein FtsL
MVRKKFNKKEILLGIVCSLLVLFILSLYVWHQTESVSLGYDTAELEHKVIQLQKEVEKLETIKSSLLSLDRVEKMAKEKLEMSEPRDDQVFYEDIDPKR